MIPPEEVPPERASRPPRRLAAVLFADIVGYTRLSAENEPAALRLVEGFQRVAREEIGRFGGAVVKFLGDGVLAEFASTEAAARCGLELRAAFGRETATGRGGGAARDLRPTPIRVGVHIGDVTVASDGDIYGDGVNVAARVQDLAEPGQVLATEEVARQLRRHPDVRLSSLGERSVRGLDAPLRLYEIGSAGPDEGAGPDRAPTGGDVRARGGPGRRRRRAMWLGAGGAALLVALASQALPRLGVAPAEEAAVERSIVVLPFDDLSEAQDQSYFSDGITEDILMHLSRIAELRVVSRASSMPYKGTTKSIREIGDELGVGHAITGSVRRSGDQLRLNVQLIDVRSDAQIWGQTFDRELTDVFRIQSEIAERVAQELAVRLTPAERGRIEVAPTGDMAAYEAYLRGRDRYHEYRPEANDQAIEEFRRAISLDPEFAPAWAGLADALSQRASRFGAGAHWADSAFAAAERAIALNPDLAEAHKALGSAYIGRGWFGDAAVALRRAVELNPSYGVAVHNLGLVSFLGGELDEAARLYRRSITLDPVGGARHLSNLAAIHIILGLFDSAESIIEELLARVPGALEGLEYRATLSIFRGEPDEARRHVRAMLERYPDDDLARLRAAGAYLLLGDDEEAARQLRAIGGEAPGPPVTGRYADVLAAYAFGRVGEPDRARAALERFEARAERALAAGTESADLRYSLAAAHAIRGDADEAIRWLEEAVRVGWSDYLMLERDPLLGSVRDDPRFVELLEVQRERAARMREQVAREGW